MRTTTASPTRDFSSTSEDLARTLRQIYDLDLTTTSGGNLSILDDDGAIWITPAGTDKGELQPDQIARVESLDDDDGGIDTPPPSSELPFHRAIYAVRSDLRAVIHAHPVDFRQRFGVGGQGSKVQSSRFKGYN